MPTLNDQIRALVEKFAADLERLFREQAMAAVRSALGGDSSAGGRRPASASLLGGADGVGIVVPARKRTAAKKTTAKKTSKRVRRNETDIAAVSERIVGYFKSNPGKRAEDAKKALKLDRTGWMIPVRKLVESGKLRAKGTRRATTYTVG